MFDPLSFLAFSFLVALAVTLGEAVRRDNVAAAVNALVGLGAALVPLVVGSVYFTSQDRAIVLELTLWVAVAGFLHSLGMLGLYESTQWWDHLTHAVSSALVAALLYGGVLTTGDSLVDSQPVAAAATLGLTLLVGVFWEGIEIAARHVAEHYDIEPVLVHYGWKDTYHDLVFDAVGALLVVVADWRIFVPFVQRLSSLV